MTRSSVIAGIAILVIAALAVGGFAMVNNNEDKPEETTMTQQAATEDKTTIVDAASASADFSTLVTAVKAADLVTALSGDSKLTVFAPTNAAFNKLPAGTVENLVMPANKETLSGILTYHVVEGAVLSNQLQNGQKVKTLNGAELTVSIESGSVYLIDAKGGKSMVTSADIEVDNGVIHAIDTVLMP